MRQWFLLYQLIIIFSYQTHAWHTYSKSLIIQSPHHDAPWHRRILSTRLLKTRWTNKHDSFKRSSGNIMKMNMVDFLKGLSSNVGLVETIITNGNEKIYSPPSGSMIGKTVVITGAASGLGLESAKRLSAAGANVVVTARSKKKTEWAVNAVNNYLQARETSTGTNNEEPRSFGHVIGIELDLEDLNSVKTFSDRYEEATNNILSTFNFSKKIDVLMNNAGMGGMSKRELTIDGYERTFQANHLGHFVLTATLFPFFNRNVQGNSKGCRVINVSSLAHTAAHLANSQALGLDLNNIVLADLEFSLLGPYQQSKLANILFTQELQRRADSAGIGEWFTSVSLEPGIIATNIWRHLVGEDPRPNPEIDNVAWSTVDASTNVIPGGKIVQWIVSNVFYRILTKTEVGSNTQIWLSSASKYGVNDERKVIIEGGCHYDEKMKKMQLGESAQDQEKARLLWEMSEKCADMKFVL